MEIPLDASAANAARNANTAPPFEAGWYPAKILEVAHELAQNGTRKTVFTCVLKDPQDPGKRRRAKAHAGWGDQRERVRNSAQLILSSLGDALPAACGSDAEGRRTLRPADTRGKVLEARVSLSDREVGGVTRPVNFIEEFRARNSGQPLGPSGPAEPTAATQPSQGTGQAPAAPAPAPEYTGPAPGAPAAPGSGGFAPPPPPYQGAPDPADPGPDDFDDDIPF